jgi:sulfur transfer complex TusBCD TusB component (DsrH family)
MCVQGVQTDKYPRFIKGNQVISEMREKNKQFIRREDLLSRESEILVRMKVSHVVNQMVYIPPDFSFDA